MSRRRIRFISTTASQRRMLDTRCLILDQTQSDRASSIQKLASRSLCPWVKLPMHSFKPLLIDVRVHLRRRNIGVAEHFLNDPQIGAIAKQVGREAMAEEGREDVFLESAALCVVFYDPTGDM